ncbi:MAG: response regulator [Marinifilaceae bacterium]|jgi:CheY-like chemotaxis protein|nr:response regulator [Marinifilaceae bacterium]
MSSIGRKYNWSDKKILIVEDEEINNMFFEAALNRTGAVLQWAKNGKEAVDIISTDQDIDIILMDIRLPIMDGCEATEKIKNIRKDIIIVAQTAYALEGDKEKILSSGCDAYLAKPIRFEELLDTIENFFGDGNSDEVNLNLERGKSIPFTSSTSSLNFEI